MCLSSLLFLNIEILALSCWGCILAKDHFYLSGSGRASANAKLVKLIVVHLEAVAFSTSASPNLSEVNFITTRN